MKRERVCACTSEPGDRLLNAFPEVKKEGKTNDVQIENNALDQNSNRYKLDLDANLDIKNDLPTEEPIKESNEKKLDMQNTLG